MSREELHRKVWDHAGQLLADRGYIAPVELLVRMDRLKPQQVEDWRRGRIPYLERVIAGNLSRLVTILDALQSYARARLEAVPNRLYVLGQRGQAQTAVLQNRQP